MASAFVAMFLGAVLLVGATVSGKKPELCAAMGGEYKPGARDECPDGKWANLLP